MPITEVGSGSQRKSGAANASVSIFATESFPANVTSGNLLIVTGSTWGSTGPATSVAVTDTLGTSYTVVLGTAIATSGRTFIAYGIAPSSGANTVTVNPAGADATHEGTFSLDEFTGVDPSPADVNGGTTSGATAIGNPFAATDTITPATSGALLIGVMFHVCATTALTAGTDYTILGENETNSGTTCHAAVFRIVTTITSYTVTINAANANPTASPGWAMQTHSFKEAAGGFDPNALNLRLDEPVIGGSTFQ